MLADVTKGHCHTRPEHVLLCGGCRKHLGAALSGYDLYRPEGGCHERIQDSGANFVVPATALAQTEWKEFTSSEGNFRVLLPDDPQQQTDAERSSHDVFSEFCVT